MTGKSVLIIGPGFIGWEVLELLVAEGYQMTGFVRREEHAAGIQKSGAAGVIMGDLDDKTLITEETAKHDIVLHTATADHKPSAEAVLDGVKKRAAAGKRTIYIHTSGTSVLDDGAAGAYRGDKIYSDDRPAEIEALPNDNPHRPIDLTIVRAARELGPRAKVAIMTPPEIYGYNPAHGRLTIQFPTLARFALQHGYCGYVGKGLSVESQVHVMDLARAYVVLLHAMEQREPSFVLENPYFFCENGSEFEWREVGQRIADALVKAGRITEKEAHTIPEKDYGDLFGPATNAVIGLNSRSRGARLRALGWTPSEKKSIWESFEQDELPAILAEWDRTEGEGRGGYKGVAAA